MAAVFPKLTRTGPLFYPIATTLRRPERGRKGVVVGLAVLGAMLVTGLFGVAADVALRKIVASQIEGAVDHPRLFGTAAAGDLPQPARVAGAFPRQPPAVAMKPVALEHASNKSCVIALGQEGKLLVGTGNPKSDIMVSLVKCDLFNASRDAEAMELVAGASLTARNIFLSGGYALSPGASMTASKYLTTYTSPVADPYAHLKVPAYSGCRRSRYKLDAGRTETLSPGVYCGGIDVAIGATLNLAPGTYILDEGNFRVSGSSTVNGTDVTIILTSRSGSNFGTIDFSTGSNITLSAPSSGTAEGTPGVALWVDEHAPTASDTVTGGNTQNINGAIYLPSQRVKYAGGSSSDTRCSQLVALAVTFTGSSYFRHDCAGSGLSDPAPPPVYHDYEAPTRASVAN